MCSKIIIDNNKKIYLDNCCRYKSSYVPYKCCKKYVKVDDCCEKYVKVDDCCKKYVKVDDCYPKYVKVDDCCKKYVKLDDCCEKYVKLDDCCAYEVHKYEKRIYYCKCCNKYKIKKVRVC